MYYGWSTHYMTTTESIAPKAKKYAQVGNGYRDTLVGTYQSNQTENDLILDSTYTYSFSVKNGSETVLLEGVWELSYKDQDQHIILHRPLPHKAIANLRFADFEERRFKVTENGLKDVKQTETYTQITTDEYSLAIYK